MSYICPYCHTALINNQESFYCKTHGIFQYKHNIYFFIKNNDNNQQTYFEEHWKDMDITKYPKSKLEVAKKFLHYIPKNSKNLKILDAGCGDGVQINFLTHTLDKSNNIYGVDISLAALQKCKHINPNSNIFYADIEFLPFEDNFFDIVYSYGVLAYVQNINNTLNELIRVTKPHGKFGVWFYPKPSFIKFTLLRIIRFLSSIYNGKLAKLFANFIVPFLYILPTASKINLSNASWNECQEIVLVNIAPKYIFFPEEQEIIDLLTKHNIKVDFISKDDKILLWGEKL